MLASLPFTTSHAEWIALAVSLISLAGIAGILSHLVCHHSHCWRRGRFRYGHYRLCHVHHPNVPSDGRITDDHIAALGRRLQRQEAGGAPAPEAEAEQGGREGSATG